MAWDIVLGFWDTMGEMAPYLLLGFVLAGILSVFISPEAVERHLGGHGFWPVLKATLFGIPLPICSCGVIPVAASLHRHGAGKGATSAFLISTPQTGVDSIAVTYGMLGPVFAIFRPLAALVSGVLGGTMVDLIDRSTPAQPAPAPACTDECCAPTAAGGSRIVRALRHGLITLPADLAKPLLIGLLIAGLINALIPAQFFTGALGAGLLPMLFMMAVGIPMYVCATASVPIAAAMILKGISPGAALVFLMTGPATNAAAIATFWKLMGRRATLAYLVSVAGTALLSGFLLDWLFTVGNLPAAHVAHSMLSPGIRHLSAITLLLVLAAGLVARSRKAAERPAHAHSIPDAIFDISGMTCSHCADSVRRVIKALPGVTGVTVDLALATASVQGSGYDTASLARAVTDLGFKIHARPDNPDPGTAREDDHCHCGDCHNPKNQKSEERDRHLK